MKREKDNQLLKEVLAGDEIDPCRHATLEYGLATLRTRRVRRAALRSAGITCVLLLVLVVLTKSFIPQHFPAVPRTSPLEASEEKIKIISDDELFALFPNRPLALVGPSGHQQLLFLDQTDSHL